MFHPGFSELVIIMIIVLIIFGAGKLPQLGEGLGKGIRNFRSGMKESPKQIEELTSSEKEEAKSEKGG
jgi:sec-independent protein translocase protein TatA